MTTPTENKTQSDNPLGMSDEEIMNMNSPSELVNKPEGEVATPPVEEQTPPEEEQGDANKPSTEQNEEVETSSTGNVEENGDNKQKETPVNTESGKPAEAPSDSAAKSTDGDKPSTEQADGKAKPDNGEKPTSEDANTSVDYKAFYETVMKPIKANGRTLDIKNPEEAIKLMQMGANYTRKMQDLAPHRKVIMMLENNGLLDSDKLSFLIDVEKKNPDAIKKLIRDSGIDPMDFDPNEQLKYQVGNHTVSDEEANFRTVLDDLKSTPEGLETLQAINGSWDQASKEHVYTNPDVISVIHEQRANGIYDRIAGEVERQKALGNVPSHVSFLQAYKAVGDVMQQNGAFADLIAKPAVATNPAKTDSRQPIETKAAAPKPQVKNSDKAAAAASSRTTSTQKASQTKNPLELSDEEFMKQFQNR